MIEVGSPFFMYLNECEENEAANQETDEDEDDDENDDDFT